MFDPDYNRAEHQRRAAKGGEVAPNGEFYPGGAFIQTKAEKPKGLTITPEGELALDGTPITEGMRRKVFNALKALGFIPDHLTPGQSRANHGMAYDFYWFDGSTPLYAGKGRMAKTLAELVAKCLAEVEARKAAWARFEEMVAKFGARVLTVEGSAVEVYRGTNDVYWYPDFRDYTADCVEALRREERRKAVAYLAEHDLKVKGMGWANEGFYIYTGRFIPAPHGRMCQTAAEVYALTTDELESIKGDE